MCKKKKNSKSSKRFFYVLLPFVLPLCLIALGILLLVNEEWVTKTFLALGSLLALIGLIEVVIFASRRKYEVQPHFLLSGIILLVVGILLLIIPLTVNTLIPVLLGLCVLVSGISGAANTITLRQQNTSIIIPMIFAIVNCLLGIFILIYVLRINPNSGWNIIGILMIISGVLRMLNELLARIPMKKSENITERQVDTTPIEATISEEEA